MAASWLALAFLSILATRQDLFVEGIVTVKLHFGSLNCGCCIEVIHCCGSTPKIQHINSFR